MPIESYEMASFTMYSGTSIRSIGSFVVSLVMYTWYDEEFPDEGHVNSTSPDINFVDIFCDWATKQMELVILLTSSFCIPLKYSNTPQLILLHIVLYSSTKNKHNGICNYKYFVI